MATATKKVVSTEVQDTEDDSPTSYSVTVMVEYRFDVDAESETEAEAEGWRYEDYKGFASVYSIDVEEN